MECVPMNEVGRALADERRALVEVFGDVLSSGRLVQGPQHAGLGSGRAGCLGVPSKDQRGEHAHRRCNPVPISLPWSVRCIVGGGTQSDVILPDLRNTALDAPTLVFRRQFDFSAVADLGVCASLPYDGADSTSDYEKFRQQARAATL